MAWGRGCRVLGPAAIRAAARIGGDVKLGERLLRTIAIVA
jgi:hypothetical protein